jgi:hypothetical protein
MGKLQTILKDLEFAFGVFDAMHEAGIINLKQQGTIDVIGQAVIGVLGKVAAQAPTPAAPAA